MDREGGEALPLLPAQCTQQRAARVRGGFSPAPALCLEHYAHMPSSMFKQNTDFFLQQKLFNRIRKSVLIFSEDLK